jgi:hypothetical protein
MNDSFGVRGVQCISDVNPEAQQFLDFDRLARDLLPECMALE